MDDEIAANEPVYEIDLTKKYVLFFDRPLNQKVVARIKHQIDEWVKSENQPFLLVDMGVRLVRVDTVDQLKSEE